MSSENKNVKVKVRIAPSPTGFFHIGTARTALFNFLFARHNRGEFILRIEDTDVARSRREYELDLTKGLRWLGIEWDGGPIHQSRRRKVYQKQLSKLLKTGQAFYCFHKAKSRPGGTHRCDHKNLDPAEVKRFLQKPASGVIRFNTPYIEIKFCDIIRGEVRFDAKDLGDFVLAKKIADPQALYNFAAVVDDHLMGITHVIRGEDHISNTPKQILLYEALGWGVPQFAHLPLIVGEDRRRLSKRHGAKPVSSYKQEGYLPEALVNFLAFLGWNPGDEREFFSMEELINEFSLTRVSKSAAVFFPKRLQYLNRKYIAKKNLDDLVKLCRPYLLRAGLLDKDDGTSTQKLRQIIALVRPRLSVLSEVVELTDFFFQENLSYPSDLLRWKDMSLQDVKNSLERSGKILDKIKEDEWRQEVLEEILLKKAKKFSQRGDRGELLWPLRVSLSGKSSSPGPHEIAAVLGKNLAMRRIKQAIRRLSSLDSKS